MTTTYIVGVTDTGSGQEQSLIPCSTNGFLFSTNTSTLPNFATGGPLPTANGMTYPGNLTNTTPAAGFLGERIKTTVASGSAVSVTNGNSTNIMSISLTAGIWDVSAILAVQGILTGISMSGSISTTSATGGTSGDNLVQVGLLNLSAAQMLTIPSYRLSLSTTTTVYLVANVGFTLGSASCYGRLGATRVG